MTDTPLDDLKRRAYSGDGEDALSARIQLAELTSTLDREKRFSEERIPIDLPDTAIASRLLGWIAALASLAAVAATGIAMGPRSSLEVFERPATALDTRMDERVPDWFPRYFPRPTDEPRIDAYWDVLPVEGSARWLGKSGGYDVFGYLGQGVDPVAGPVVCLSISRSRAVLVIWCVPEQEFAQSGIQEHRQSRPVDRPVHLTVLWGPTGDARIFDRPLEEITGR